MVENYQILALGVTGVYRVLMTNMLQNEGGVNYDEKKT